MRHVSVLLLSVCVVVAAAFAAAPRRAPELVTRVADENITSFVQTNERTAIMFFSPYTQLCRLFRAEFESAAAVAKEEGLSVSLADLNGFEEDELARTIGVTRLPTVVYFRGNENRTVFDGALTWESLLCFLREQEGRAPGSASHELSDVEDSLRWLFWRGNPGSELSPTLLAVLPSPTTEQLSLWEEASRELQSAFRVGHTSAPEVIAAVSGGEAQSQASVALYRSFDEGKTVFPWPQSIQQLSELAKSYSVPSVAWVDHTGLRRAQRRKNVLAHLFVPESRADRSSEGAVELREELFSAAKRLYEEGLAKRGELTIAITNGDKYSAWMRQFRLGGGEPLPQLGVADNRASSPNGAGSLFAFGTVENGTVAQQVYDALAQVFRATASPVPPLTEEEEKQAEQEATEAASKKTTPAAGAGHDEL